MTPTELRKLRTYTEFVRKWVKALDAQMQLPSTPERGRAVAKLTNMLEETNSRIRYFLLDIDYRTEKPRRGKN